jgi:hypothetical protein
MKEEITALVPDFYDWPQRWMGVDEDLEYGHKLLKHFEPFVSNLATDQLAKKTKKKHADNLWLAGGELIRTVSMEENYQIAPKELILKHFGMDGGPYCQHLKTEDELNSYDSSCRKFYKFITREGNQSR